MSKSFIESSNNTFGDDQSSMKTDHDQFEDIEIKIGSRGNRGVRPPYIG